MQSVIKSVWGRFVAYFLAGVLAVLPLVITVAVVAWVVGFIYRLVEPATTYFALNAIGWLIALGVIFGLGIVIVELGAKRLLSRLVDPIIARIPLIGSVYGTSKQFINVLDRTGEDQLKGMTPVFCSFGDRGGAGMLALLVTSERFTIHGREYQVVIVPTAPIPFGGWLVFVPTESVQPAGMTVDGLMSVYVSMGATASQHLPPQTMPDSTST